MKRIYLVSMLLFVISTVIAFAQEEQSFKKYDMISGYVEFKLSGLANGSQELYFEEYGKYEAVYAKGMSNYLGNKIHFNYVEIKTPDASYNIDFIKTQGIKDSAVDYNDFIEMFKSEGGNFEKMMERKLKKDGYNKTGMEKVLDRDCAVWETLKDDARYISWIWRGIPLKEVYEYEGFTATTEAIKILEEEPIPFFKFEPPGGIEWVKYFHD